MEALGDGPELLDRLATRRERFLCARVPHDADETFLLQFRVRGDIVARFSQSTQSRLEVGDLQLLELGGGNVTDIPRADGARGPGGLLRGLRCRGGRRGVLDGDRADDVRDLHPSLLLRPAAARRLGRRPLLRGPWLLDGRRRPPVDVHPRDDRGLLGGRHGSPVDDARPLRGLRTARVRGTHRPLRRAPAFSDKFRAPPTQGIELPGRKFGPHHLESERVRVVVGIIHESRLDELVNAVCPFDRQRFRVRLRDELRRKDDRESEVDDPRVPLRVEHEVAVVRVRVVDAASPQTHVGPLDSRRLFHADLLRLRQGLALHETHERDGRRRTGYGASPVVRRYVVCRVRHPGSLDGGVCEVGVHPEFLDRLCHPWSDVVGEFQDDLRPGPQFFRRPPRLHRVREPYGRESPLGRERGSDVRSHRDLYRGPVRPLPENFRDATRPHRLVQELLDLRRPLSARRGDDERGRLHPVEGVQSRPGFRGLILRELYRTRVRLFPCSRPGRVPRVPPLRVVCVPPDLTERFRFFDVHGTHDRPSNRGMWQQNYSRDLVSIRSHSFRAGMNCGFPSGPETENVSGLTVLMRRTTSSRLPTPANIRAAAATEADLDMPA